MKVEPAIEVGIDECEHCSMIIQNVDQGAVAIDSGEQLHTFCNPVCLIKEIDKLKREGTRPSWQAYLFGHGDDSAISVSNAFIVHGEFETAMGYGLLAFKTRESADKFASELSGEVISWDDLRLEHEYPDVSIKLLSEKAGETDAFEALRGEIVQVIYNNDTDQAETITLSGYGFRLQIQPRSKGEGAFVANKPGQGFSFERFDGTVLGMLFVGGDHTAEEAIYK